MKQTDADDWNTYSDIARQIVASDAYAKGQLLFRGLRDARWRSRTTLDRERTFRDDLARDSYYGTLLSEFRSEAMQVLMRSTALPDGDALDLVARHHGVPSPFLDWTRSPYIAAFFAFQEESKDVDVPAAIWVFAPPSCLASDAELTIITDPDLIRFNPRAKRQRGGVYANQNDI